MHKLSLHTTSLAIIGMIMFPGLEREAGGNLDRMAELTVQKLDELKRRLERRVSWRKPGTRRPDQP